MTQDPRASVETTDSIEHVRAIRIRQWLWDPWFAKLWWGSIPVYWSLIFFTPLGDLLERAIWSGFVSLLGILFSPAAPLLILSMPVLRDQLGLTSFEQDDEGNENDGSEDPKGPPSLQHRRPRSLTNRSDVSNPCISMLPLNLSNPAYPCRHRHRHHRRQGR